MKEEGKKAYTRRNEDDGEAHTRTHTQNETIRKFL